MSVQLDTQIHYMYIRVLYVEGCRDGRCLEVDKFTQRGR